MIEPIWVEAKDCWPFITYSLRMLRSRRAALTCSFKGEELVTFIDICFSTYISSDNYTNFT